MKSSFSTVLTRLKQLQSVGLHGWSTAMLPALAQCTQLTLLRGEWVAAAAAGRGKQNPDSAPLAECPAIRSIEGMRPVPFAAFKRLETAAHWEPWPPAAFRSIAQHCQQLRALGIHLSGLSQRVGSPSMPASASAEERVVAIRSLSQLPQLQYLELAVNDSAEAAALAAATQLEELWLRVPSGSSCSIAGIMHVVALRHLKCLMLELCELPVSAAEAESLLVALQFVSSVEVMCPEGSGLRGVFEAAQLALQAAGMLTPDDLEIAEHDFEEQ
jgi:hypothetical protein